MRHLLIARGCIFLLSSIMLNAPQVLATIAQETNVDELLLHKNHEMLYICFDNSLSDIALVIGALSALDSDKSSPVFELRQYLDNGHEVALRDEVLSVLDYAEWFVGHYYDKDIQRLIAPQLEKVIEQVLRGELDVSEQEVMRSADMRLTVNSKARFKESVRMDKNLYVHGKAHFDDDVEFKDDVKMKKNLIIKGSLTVDNGISVVDTVSGDVTIVNLLVTDTLTSNSHSVQDQTVGGTLSATDTVVSCDLSVGCNINMNNTSMNDAMAIVGVINKEGVRFIHNFGLENIFLGVNAGNFTMSGSGNTAVGSQALSLNGAGSSNVAIGGNALRQNTSGQHNTAIGYDALRNNVVGMGNVALGWEALLLSPGDANVAVGSQAGNKLTSGANNIFIGANAGSDLTSGLNNIYLGFTTEVPLVSSENNVIRIGTNGTHERAFMAGVLGVNVGGTGMPVYIASNGQLGTAVSSKRFKHAIESIHAESVGLYDLRPVKFVYNNDETKTNQYGLIAEEVSEIFPELVIKDKDGSPLSVRYEVLPVLLLNEMKKLSHEVAAAKEAFAAVKKQLEHYVTRS